MRGLLALAAVALAAGCGGDDELTRAEAQQRATEAIADAVTDGRVGRGITRATAAADESMNRDAGVPLGSGVEEPDQVTFEAVPDLQERDDGWMATYEVAGVDEVVVCVLVTANESEVAVRARC